MANEGKALTVVIVLFCALLMAAILFPVFVREVEPSRKAECQTHLKELGMALKMYVDENNDTLPSSAVCGSSDEVFRKTLGGSLEDKPARTIFQLISPYMKNKQITKCPSDTTNNEVSYVLKKAVNDAWLDPKIKARKMNDYNWPADQIMFYERGSFHWGDDSDVSDPSNPKKQGETINCMLWDGHVKALRMTQFEPDYYNTDGNRGTPTKRPQIDPRRYCDSLQ